MESTSGTPHLLTDVRFTVARKGYDPDEVDNFLERVSAAVAQLQEKLRQATADAEAAEARAAEAAALRRCCRLASTSSRPTSPRPGPGTGAGSRARGPEDEAAEVSKVLVLAQRTADAAVAEAHATATQTVAEAEQEASRDPGHGPHRGRRDRPPVSASRPRRRGPASLEATRDQLSSDIAALEPLPRGPARVARPVRSTRIQAVLDDPACAAPGRRRRPAPRSPRSPGPVPGRPEPRARAAPPPTPAVAPSRPVREPPQSTTAPTRRPTADSRRSEDPTLARRPQHRPAAAGRWCSTPDETERGRGASSSATQRRGGRRGHAGASSRPTSTTTQRFGR